MGQQSARIDTRRLCQQQGLSTPLPDSFMSKETSTELQCTNKQVLTHIAQHYSSEPLTDGASYCLRNVHDKSPKEAQLSIADATVQPIL